LHTSLLVTVLTLSDQELGPLNLESAGDGIATFTVSLLGPGGQGLLAARVYSGRPEMSIPVGLVRLGSGGRREEASCAT